MLPEFILKMGESKKRAKVIFDRCGSVQGNLNQARQPAGSGSEF